MTSTIVLLVELVALFIGVSFLVEMMQRRLGPERLRQWMGGRPVTAALKGIAVGFVTPFCTYSAIPLLVGLRRAGVPPAGYVAFIAAAPVLDPILFGALLLIVGPTVAATYVTVTFTAALGLALLAQRLGIERYLKPVEASSSNPVPVPVAVAGAAKSRLEGGEADALGLDSAAAASSCATGAPNEPWRGWAVESRRALASSGRLLRSFGPLLLVGVALGVAIEAFVSPEAAARVTTGSPWTSIPAAAGIGTPLYFSTELFVPIANSLHNAGVGVGAIVALTIAGAGANLPEFVVLSKMAKPGAISVFFAYVFGVAMIGGLIAHSLSGQGL